MSGAMECDSPILGRLLEGTIEESPRVRRTPLSEGLLDLDVEVTPSSSEGRKKDEQKE